MADMFFYFNIFVNVIERSEIYISAFDVYI